MAVTQRGVGAGTGWALLSAASFGSSGTFGGSLIEAGWSPALVVLIRIAVGAALLAVRARQAGLLIPDRTLGLAWSGAMTPARVAGLLAHLPDGLTELYTHPATGGGFPGEAPGYAYAAERDALIAPATRATLAGSGAIRGGFSDFAS